MHVVTGSIMREGLNLRVTMEQWMLRITAWLGASLSTVPSQEMLRLQDQLSSRLRSGLVPALGGRALGGGVRSSDPRAYELFYARRGKQLRRRRRERKGNRTPATGNAAGSKLSPPLGEDLATASITKHNISVAASGSTNCRVTRHSEPCN